MPDEPARNPAAAYVLWGGLLGAALQGFWLVTSVYIVVDVGLDPLQLILLGTVLELTILVAEVPTGVMADTVSRKWSLVVSMVVMAAAFLLVAASGSFTGLAVGMVLWGIGWTFTSGADVAWISDELLAAGAPQRTIDRTLTRKAAWQQWGGACGLVGFGALGWWTTPITAMAAAGATMLALAVLIAMRFAEDGFNRSADSIDTGPARILADGVALVRSSRVIARILIVTVLFNLGAEAVDRLTEKRLIDLGLPNDVSPVAFFAGLGLAGLVAGAGLLRAIEPTVATQHGPRVVYGAMALLAGVGALAIALAGASEPAIGSNGAVAMGTAGIFAARGLAWAVLPTVSAVWVNRAATGEVRATVQSFVGQATSIGQLVGGLALGVVATVGDIPAALAVSAGLFSASGLLILADRTGERSAG